jgi:hypothetical protein
MKNPIGRRSFFARAVAVLMAAAGAKSCVDTAQPAPASTIVEFGNLSQCQQTKRSGCVTEYDGRVYHWTEFD